MVWRPHNFFCEFFKSQSPRASCSSRCLAARASLREERALAARLRSMAPRSSKVILLVQDCRYVASLSRCILPFFCSSTLSKLSHLRPTQHRPRKSMHPRVSGRPRLPTLFPLDINPKYRTPRFLTRAHAPPSMRIFCDPSALCADALLARVPRNLPPASTIKFQATQGAISRALRLAFQHRIVTPC